MSSREPGMAEESDGGADAQLHSDTSLLTAVARRYYEGQATQVEIAREIGVSRATVSRFLAEARRVGIVRISVGEVAGRDAALESWLKATFSIAEAHVAVTHATPMNALHVIAQQGAVTFDEHMTDGVIVGVSNGRTVAKVVELLFPARPHDAVVVQLIGSVGQGNLMIDGPEIARMLAERYGAAFWPLPAPLVVDGPTTRVALEQSWPLVDALRKGREAQLALVGIGSLADSGPAHIFDGYLTSSDLRQIRDNGAVGHLCGQFFDAAGELISAPINERIVGIGLASLRQIPAVVAVAGGADKAGAILAALRGGLVDVLVTDSAAALRIREMAGRAA